MGVCTPPLIGSFFGIVVGVSWLIASGVIWSERAVDDWYAFRDGLSTCSLLNQSFVPFRAMTLARCSACSPPSGSTGALGSSCSAYEAFNQQTSPYSNDGAVPFELQGSPVCETSSTTCCREECDTCRSCTGSGSDRSCTSKKCRCKCVDRRNTRCVVDTATEWEARMHVWINDILSHPDVVSAIPISRGIFSQDLTTPEEFKQNPVPYGRRGFPSQSAAQASTTWMQPFASAAKAGADQLDRFKPEPNCLVSSTFVPDKTLLSGETWFAPAALINQPSLASGNGPSTILLTDAELRQRYVSPSIQMPGGPPVPYAKQQIVSKGDMRFAVELLEVPQWYWAMFIVPGFILAISLCGCFSAIPGKCLDATEREPDWRLCWFCAMYGSSLPGRRICAFWGLVVVPTCVFVPMFTSMRATDHDTVLRTAIGIALGLWIVATLIFIVDVCPAKSAIPSPFAILAGTRSPGASHSTSMYTGGLASKPREFAETKVDNASLKSMSETADEGTSPPPSFPGAEASKLPPAAGKEAELLSGSSPNPPSYASYRNPAIPASRSAEQTAGDEKPPGIPSFAL